MTSLDDLHALMDALPAPDRERFLRRVAGARKVADRSRREQILETLEAEMKRIAMRTAARRRALPSRIVYPPELPIAERRDALLSTIRDNQVVIVAGETGSGKSTQLPKLCVELGRGIDGYIGHTQPRRIAARSIAERVAEELNCRVGELVGYTVRFNDQVGDSTLIRLMTDGILLNEIHRDRLLTAYDTLIIDEAHERSLNIDFLLGYLRQLLPQRPDLKVIITSATIDTERFSTHFDGAPIIEVSGRMYPVEVRYRPLVEGDGRDQRDQTTGITDAVGELVRGGPGDILVFCSGEREIRDAVSAIEDLHLKATEVLPLYGRLSAAEQHRVFSPPRGRRIVVATNVAETSLTVPGIRYVVDPGTARISRFSRRTKVQRLPIEAISRASADQRAGRCGRLGPGVAIRLYSEEDYASRPEYTDPEILRTSLASVILQMAAVGLGGIELFPFVEPPDTRAIRDGINLLEELGAVEPNHRGTERWLTKLGRRLARLPVDPRLARMIIESDRYACLREVLIIASALSIQDPRERPTGQEPQADELHRRFADATSDFNSWLSLWHHVRRERKARTSSQFRRMCRDEFLHYQRIREWQDVHGQLRDIAKELGLRANRAPADAESVHRALLSGLLSQVGVKEADGHAYRGARGARFAISPASNLFKANPPWVMAAELVETTRLWAHAVARVDPDWIERAAHHLVRRSYSQPWWDEERGTALASETATVYGLPLVSGRVVQFGSIDPAAARKLFIEHALVAGEWETHHRFADHNASIVSEVLEMEARERRSDLLVDDESVVAWFSARIPDDIVSVRHFDAWWKDERHRVPDLLELSTSDLIAPGAEALDEDAFPHTWSYGDLDLALDYEFDPTSDADGVTVDVPLAALDRIDPTAFEWQVPGLRGELIERLIRSLPKRIRREFVPIPDTVRELVGSLESADGGLIDVLRRALTRRSGIPILPDAFDLQSLPPHLTPRYRIVGADGVPIAEGGDLAALRSLVQETAVSAITETSHALERTGLTSWSIGELPVEVELTGSGTPVLAFPALVDEGDVVSVRLLATVAEQMESMWAGTRRLLQLQLPPASKLLRPLLTPDVKLALVTSPYEGPADWMSDVASAAVSALMAEAEAPAWNATEFDRLLAHVRDRFGAAAVEIGEQSASALALLRGIRAEIDTHTRPNFPQVASDIEGQLHRFVYPGFLTGIGAGRVPDVVRYLRAIEWRLARVAENPPRDLALMERIGALEAQLDELVEQLPWSPELVEIAWMLEELRVSLFAQSIGAKGPISEKRVARAMRSLVGLPA